MAIAFISYRFSANIKLTDKTHMFAFNDNKKPLIWSKCHAIKHNIKKSIFTQFS